MPKTPRPQALGLVRHRPDDGELQRSTARVELAFHARLTGYALIETFELDGRADLDRRTLRAVDHLLHRSVVEVLIVHGGVDDEDLEPILDRHGLRLDVVSQPPPVGAA